MSPHLPPPPRELTVSLGGRWHGRYGTAYCPAHDDRNPSLSITERDGKLLLKCHAGCSQDAVIAAFRARGLWPEAGERRERVPWQPPARTKPAPPDNRDRALKIWRETRAAPGTLTDGYLAARCIRHAIPAQIRHHDRLEYWDRGKLLGHWPAMVTRLDDPDGRFCGIQRLYLDPTIDANPVGKAPVPAPRKTLGPIGVAWFGRRDLATIIVGEGVETALSARELGDPSWPSYGRTPVACISANGLARFEPPPTIRRLFISEDNDPAGRQATATLADRAARRGIDVTIMRFEEIK